MCVSITCDCEHCLLIIINAPQAQNRQINRPGSAVRVPSCYERCANKVSRRLVYELRVATCRLNGCWWPSLTQSVISVLMCRQFSIDCVDSTSLLWFKRSLVTVDFTPLSKPLVTCFFHAHNFFSGNSGQRSSNTQHGFFNIMTRFYFLRCLVCPTGHRLSRFRPTWLRGQNFRPRSRSVRSRPRPRPHAMLASFSWRLSS